MGFLRRRAIRSNLLIFPEILQVTLVARRPIEYDEPRREPHYSGNRHGSVVAISALRSKLRRRVYGENGTDASST